MNQILQPSWLLTNMCSSLEAHSVSGLQLSAEDVIIFRRNLLMIRELTAQIEEENVILERQLAARRVPVSREATVLPFRPRLRIAPLPDDGGDAA